MDVYFNPPQSMQILLAQPFWRPPTVLICGSRQTDANCMHFLPDSTDLYHSIRVFLQHGEGCELRSTRFDIDQSFLGLDRIRSAWNARHSMLCNTTYSGLRPLSIISVVSQHLLFLFLYQSVLPTVSLWDPRATTEAHSHLFSSMSLVPL